MMLVSCSIKQDLSTSRLAVDEFHQQFKAQQDEKILADATPEFRKSMSADAVRALFARIRRKLGIPHLSQPTNLQVDHMPAGILIRAQYRTRFDNGDAQEYFTWRILKGEPHLVAYFIDSPLLAVD